jgi:putative ABC transport system ATP-binding protein
MSGNGRVIIRIEQLKRFYKVGVEEIHALDGVDLEVRDNEYLAVMGHSGSGKSTLMNVIGCLDRPSSGRYEFDGDEVTELGDAELAMIRNERIGCVSDV